jgi:hypothetical protein
VTQQAHRLRLSEEQESERESRGAKIAKQCAAAASNQQPKRNRDGANAMSKLVRARRPPD